MEGKEGEGERREGEREERKAKGMGGKGKEGGTEKKEAEGSKWREGGEERRGENTETIYNEIYRSLFERKKTLCHYHIYSSLLFLDVEGHAHSSSALDGEREKKNYEIISSFGEPFMEIVCRDACDGHEITRVSDDNYVHYLIDHLSDDHLVIVFY